MPSLLLAHLMEWCGLLELNVQKSHGKAKREDRAGYWLWATIGAIELLFKDLELLTILLLSGFLIYLIHY